MAITQKMWTTFQEKEFLNKIGTHLHTRDRPEGYPGRAFFLRRYLESMHLRTDWDGVDAEEIRGYVKMELDRICQTGRAFQ